MLILRVEDLDAERALEYADLLDLEQSIDECDRITLTDRATFLV